MECVMLHSRSTKGIRVRSIRSLMMSNSLIVFQSTQVLTVPSRPPPNMERAAFLNSIHEEVRGRFLLPFDVLTASPFDFQEVYISIPARMEGIGTSAKQTPGIHSAPYALSDKASAADRFVIVVIIYLRVPRLTIS